MMSPTPAPGDRELEQALAYGARGWRVVPIVPGEKRPPLGNWTEVATSDPDKIRTWWDGRYRGFGVGIVCGWNADRTRCLFVIDIDTGHVEGVDGNDTLHDLEHTHGQLPATAEVLTGSGGRHLYLWAPVEIRNDAGRRLGPGLDIRGEGGQVLAPPTVHPNGTRYEWEVLSPTEPAEAPAWLIELLTAEPERPEPAPRVTTEATGDRPGDRFNAAADWTQLLELSGATLHHYDRTTPGDEHWTRPGKDPREGSSAVLHRNAGEHGVLTVFTSGWPGLEEGQSYSPFAFYTAIWHHGDWQAAREAAQAAHGGHVGVDLAAAHAWAATLPAATTGTEKAPRRPLAVRHVPTYRSDPPPPEEPIVEGLINRGEFTVLGAERAIGKSWLAMNLAVLLSRGEGRLFGTLEVARRCRVLILQGELDPTQASLRWGMLTYPGDLPDVYETFERARVEVLRSRVTTTVDGITTSDEIVRARMNQRLVDTLDDLEPDVVIIDPWATFIGGSESSNDDTEATCALLRELAIERQITWFALHHFGKSSDYREPEDMWRGASRLADWAANRITVARYYQTESAWKKAGLERREARRCARVHFLRRGAPLDDITARLGPNGWWEAWEPAEGDEPAQRGISDRQVLNLLAAAGGRWESDRQAAEDCGCSVHTVRDRLRRLEDAGLVRRIGGVGKAQVTEVVQ